MQPELPRVFLVRIPNCPITGLERWRYATLTSNGQPLISIDKHDKDITTDILSSLKNFYVFVPPQSYLKEL